jgi:glycosyl hydrolase family 76
MKRGLDCGVGGLRALLAATVLAAVLISPFLGGPPSAFAARRRKPRRPPPSLSVAQPLFAAKRADKAMHRAFGLDHDLLAEEAERGGRARYAFAWSTSQALAADIAVAKAASSRVALARVHRDLDGLSYYWDESGSPPGYDSSVAAPLGNGGTRYYDDNAWIGLDLIRAYRLTREPALLKRAEEVFTFTKSGWDTNPSDPYPGGVFWTQSHSNRDRNTVSTGGAAKLGLELYLITGQQADLEAARSMLAWVDGTLRAPGGLYWDHVGIHGAINKRQWSYNQGLMLGAYLLLYRATGELSALRESEAIATASLRSFRAGAFGSQPSIFNAIYFRNLAELNATAPNKAYVNAMRAFVRSLDSHVPRRTGLIHSDGSLDLLEQAAATTANAYLSLAQR